MTYSLRNLKIFSFLIYFIMILTNQYYSFEDATLIGFSDQQQYLNIINASPSFPIENISPPQAYRFMIPYLIGIFSNFIDINIYNFLIVLVIISHLLIINLFSELTFNIGSKKNFSLIVISSLIFNAYAFRPTLISPFLINDWIFVYGLLLIMAFLIKKKESYFYIGLIICVLTRQTSLLLNLVFLLIIFYNFTKKTKIKTSIYWYGILINTLIFILLYTVSSILYTDFTKKIHYTELISGIFYSGYSLLDLVNFILRFINAHLFTIVLSIFLITNIKTYKKFLNFDTLLVLLFGMFIWIQPILGGPQFTGGNIARLTIISEPIILIFFIYIFKDLEINLTQTITIIFLLGICSFHHNYTFFLNNFFDYKSFHFAGLNLFLHIVIMIILFKKNMY